MEHKFNKQIIGLLIVAAFGGGIVGSLVSSQWARAGITNAVRSSLTKSEAQLSGTSDHEQAVVSVVEKASPAVVSIIISKDVPVIEQCVVSDPFTNLPEEYRQFFNFGGMQFSQPCQKGTKKQEVGGGSGFIISADGYIVTNKHVVSDKDASYTVLTNDGKKYEARVLAQDPVFDLAIVKIEARDLATLSLGVSSGVKLGQTAIAIGNALGEFRNTISVGAISGLSRNITASNGINGAERIEGVFQTDAAINPGNSGGPLLNLRGEVIGVNVATVSGAQNIGFAIPIDQAKRAIDSVRKNGKIVAPYIGIRYVAITPELAESEKLPVSNGALLRGSGSDPAVVSGSPAATAGLREGDIITKVGGEPVDLTRSLSLLLQKHSARDIVTVTVLREGRTFPVMILLGERQ